MRTHASRQARDRLRAVLDRAWAAPAGSEARDRLGCWLRAWATALRPPDGRPGGTAGGGGGGGGGGGDAVGALRRAVEDALRDLRRGWVVVLVVVVVGGGSGDEGYVTSSCRS
jgi:hypothetical protein